MKTFEEIKKILGECYKDLQKAYGVKSVGIFGSVARGEQKVISDIDIVVEFEKSIGLKFFELADHLENILGVKVDLLTADALKQKPLLWKSVEEDIIYV